MKRLIFLLPILLLSSCIGPCSAALPKQKSADVTSKTNQVSAKNFDLESIIGLIKQNKVKDMAQLEALINEQNTTLNNVDTDKDGKVDYVQVRETRKGDEIQFDFAAIASANATPKKAVPVASVTFKYVDADKRMHLTGNYADGVEGGNQQYRTTVVQNGPSWGQMFFFAWLMTPSRPMFYQPHAYRNYHPHASHPQNSYQKRKQAFRRNSGLNPVGSHIKRPDSKTKAKGWFNKLKNSNRKPFRFGGRKGFGRGFRR